MLFCRFTVKVTAVWGQGSNVDVALDDIAIGAACFSKGKQMLTCYHKMLETLTNHLIMVQNIFPTKIAYNQYK